MVCKCGKDVYYIKKYEGTELCKRCFVRSVEKKVKRLIRQNKLLESRDNICVALSGGKDSVSCLYILSSLTKKRKDIDIFAISIDEGLGKYREETIKKAKEACKILDIDLRVYSFKKEFGKSLPELLKDMNLNACTICGVLRRYLINKKARELGATKVAYGFNLNDEVESIFLNFIFGNLDKFLRLGSKVENKKIKKFIPRIKPLREILEEEVFAYADTICLPYYREKICPYGRESVRKTIRKTIYELEKKYPGTTYQIVKFADLLIKPLRE
ncbi:MAG TPA: tRNA 2-thiocytidine biosynthesis protein TtcA, partial [Candidatus Aenigmarchaeota archaeon]|nr:tRNA 2-thiocytidine biosynthesis protein TtcA [Candidatus Aenigmarchaeota archaeon]